MKVAKMACLILELTAVAIGATRGALDVYEGVLREKKFVFQPFTPLFEMPEHQQHFARAQRLIDTADSALASLADQYVESCRKELGDGIPFLPESRRRIHCAEEQWIDLAWEAIELMFRVAGSSSGRRTAMLGRYFRNLAVIRTHVAIQADHTGRNAGRLHFGLPQISPS